MHFDMSCATVTYSKKHVPYTCETRIYTAGAD